MSCCYPLPPPAAGLLYQHIIETYTGAVTGVVPARPENVCRYKMRDTYRLWEHEKGEMEVCSILSYQRGTGECLGKQKDLTIFSSQISVYCCNYYVYLLPKQVRYQAALHPEECFF
jgi:hypothetical protein